MRLLPITLVTVLLTACSTHKHRIENSVMTTNMKHREAMLSDTASYRVTRARIVHAETGQLTELNLLPKGTFRYHPDSGYIGEAEKLSIRIRTMARHTRSDSLESNERRASTKRTALHEARQTKQHAAEQQVTRKRLAPLGYGWLWFSVILGVLVVLYRWIRRKL